MGIAMVGRKLLNLAVHDMLIRKICSKSQYRDSRLISLPPRIKKPTRVLCR